MLHEPREYNAYEGALDAEGPGIWFDPAIGEDARWVKRWRDVVRVELRMTPTKIVLIRRAGGVRGERSRRMTTTLS